MPDTLALCIPAYNAATYLPRLLRSAHNQHVPFNEILVYDDRSTDDTAAVATAYGATVIRGDVNKGCSFGKNALAAITTCNWVHFHDADDELLPNFTTLAHRWMDKTDCPDVVLFDYEYRDNDTNELITIRHFDASSLEQDPIGYAIDEQLNPFCGLYRKMALLNVGGYDIDPLILYNEDKAFHIKLALNNLTFSAENEVSIVNYHINNSMSAANRQKCIVAQYHVLKQTAAVCGNTYSHQLGAQLWLSVTLLASLQQWELANEALALSKKLGYRPAMDGSPTFNLLVRVDPFMAVWLREKLIRLFKPGLRRI